jgi:hypothetical protein
VIQYIFVENSTNDIWCFTYMSKNKNSLFLGGIFCYETIVFFLSLIG